MLIWHQSCKTKRFEPTKKLFTPNRPDVFSPLKPGHFPSFSTNFQVGGVTQRCRLLLIHGGGVGWTAGGFFPRDGTLWIGGFLKVRRVFWSGNSNFLVGANLLGGDFVGRWPSLNSPLELQNGTMNDHDARKKLEKAPEKKPLEKCGYLITDRFCCTSKKRSCHELKLRGFWSRYFFSQISKWILEGCVLIGWWFQLLLQFSTHPLQKMSLVSWNKSWWYFLSGMMKWCHEWRKIYDFPR